MNKPTILPFFLLFLFSCYSLPDFKNFDMQKWKARITNCHQTKVDLAESLLNQQDKLLTLGQAEVKSILGQPDEHELYVRSQKFFYYDLTAQSSDSCGITPQRLSIRFDALDRVKEIMIIEMK